MACDEREAAVVQEKSATTPLSPEEDDSVDDERKATAEPEAGTEGTSALVAVAKREFVVSIFPQATAVSSAGAAVRGVWYCVMRDEVCAKTKQRDEE